MHELNIGGSNMTVELDGNNLSAKANTGNKQWVAVITDTHPKYNYDRDFVAYQKPKTSDRDSGTATVEEGAVIERVRFTHSGKNRKNQFFQLVDGEAYQIDEAEVTAALDGEIVPEIEEETHECEECGDEFDSEHGLAVHQGIKHSDDEETEDNIEEPSMTESNTDDTSTKAMADGGAYTEPVKEVLEGGINEVIVRTPSHDYRFTKGASDDDVTHVYCGTVENDQEIPIGEVPSNVFDALEDAGHSPNRETTPHPAGYGISLVDSDSSDETDDNDGRESMTDSGIETEAVSVPDLSEGDRILFGERTESLTVVAADTEWARVEGPRGAAYDIEQVSIRGQGRIPGRGLVDLRRISHSPIADGGEELSNEEWETVQEYLREHLNVIRETYEEDSNKHAVVKETDSYIVLSDGHGHELFELAEETDVDNGALRARMHDEARKRTDYGWGYSDPVVIKKHEVVTDGGTEQIRDYRSIEHSDDIARDVSNPDGHLYAYREGDDHVVVSRGNEPRTRWTKRVPAERDGVLTGEHLWTIPENWVRRVNIKGVAPENCYAIYHIPETDVDVLVTVPANNHLVDKWYGVKRVGTLSVTYDDEIAWAELEALIENAHDAEKVSDDAVEVLDTLHRRRRSYEREFADAVNEFAEDALFEGAYEPILVQEWTIDPWGDHHFDPENDHLREFLNVDRETLKEVVKNLESRNIIPNYPTVRVDVEDGKGVPNGYDIHALAEAGASGAETIDYLITEHYDLMTQTDWAEVRGKGSSAISKNVSGAKKELSN